MTVVPGDLPTPSFDEALPGFENVPPVSLKDVEAAMERITRGNEAPPGFYRPDEADTRAPLS
jgi:hypothetical protein